MVEWRFVSACKLLLVVELSDENDAQAPTFEWAVLSDLLAVVKNYTITFLVMQTAYLFI